MRSLLIFVVFIVGCGATQEDTRNHSILVGEGQLHLRPFVAVDEHYKARDSIYITIDFNVEVDFFHGRYEWEPMGSPPVWKPIYVVDPEAVVQLLEGKVLQVRSLRKEGGMGSSNQSMEGVGDVEG